MQGVVCVLLAALAVMCVPGSAVADPYPVTIVDDRNVAVTIEARPQRISSLGAFAADMAASLGAEPMGTTTYNGVRALYLGDALDGAVDLGSMLQPNLELMTENRTDLIIGMRRYTEAHADDFARLAPYLAYELLTYEDSKRAIASAAAAMGHEEKGTRFNTEFEELVVDHAAKAPGGVSAVFIWLWQDALFAYYDHPMPASFLGALKVRNVMGPSPNPLLHENAGRPISYEELLALDPDVLMIYRAEGNSYPDNPALKRLNAVRNNRAFHVGYQYSQPHGPIARELVFREMSHLFYPEIFAKPDLGEGIAAEPISFEQ